jgi:uncharacterized membrane protein YphA (DoxX/SURF4 family)
MTSPQAKPPPLAMLIVGQIFPRLLGILFIFVGARKIMQLDALKAVLEFDHLPEKFLSPAAWIIVGIEIGLGILLMLWPRRQILAASIVLLALYTVQIIYLLIAHAAPNCNCLGGVIAFQNARTANFVSLARNVLLLAASWLTWMLLPGERLSRYSTEDGPASADS